MIQFIEKMKTSILECFYIDIEIYCGNSDGEYYEKERIDSFLAWG